LQGCSPIKVSEEFLRLNKDPSLISYRYYDYPNSEISQLFAEASSCKFLRNHKCALHIYRYIHKYADTDEEKGFAECSIASYYRIGNIVEKDIELAKKLLQSSCDKNLSCGCVTLQFMLDQEL
jgi:TPR repeat protein